MYKHACLNSRFLACGGYISEEHENIAFAKVDIDDNDAIAADNKIAAVPTFIFYNKGKEVSRFSGASEGNLREEVERLADR